MAREAAELEQEFHVPGREWPPADAASFSFRSTLLGGVYLDRRFLSKRSRLRAVRRSDGCGSRVLLARGPTSREDRSLAVETRSRTLGKQRRSERASGEGIIGTVGIGRDSISRRAVIENASFRPRSPAIRRETRRCSLRDNRVSTQRYRPQWDNRW